MAESKSARGAVDAVLGTPMTKEVWTANYPPVLPFTLQDFTVGALLPAMFYMFRRGKRRGKGSFREKFQPSAGGRPTVEDVVQVLTADRSKFVGCDGEAQRALLGDLLLASCLENRGHRVGRREVIQRAYPTHFLSSWIDLPDDVANLRFVPEALVTLLSCHRGDPPSRQSNTGFSISARPEENVVLSVFGTGVQFGTSKEALGSDRFDEDAKVGIDQLLTVRISQVCGTTPLKEVGSGRSEIPPQLPIAQRPAVNCYEDLRVFLSAFGRTVPRRSLLPMLESAIAAGTYNIFLSTLRMLLDWERTGRLPTFDAQLPWPVLADCSGSTDAALRYLAEESMEHCLQGVARLAVVLMCLRLVDYAVRYDRKMEGEKLPPRQPDATEWINLLGDVVHERHKHSDRILDKFHERCTELAEKLKADDQHPDAVEALASRPGSSNPAWRLAAAVTLLMGDKLQRRQHIQFLDSCLMLNEHNGLGRSRRVKLRNPSAGGYKTAEARSVVLTNTALDFLVHRHLRKGGPGEGREPRSLSLSQFIQRLRERYGFYVDEAPPGLAAPRELLMRNRQTLERRLRDLGVLVGVNDAESMKRLRQRFTAQGDDHDAI